MRHSLLCLLIFTFAAQVSWAGDIPVVGLDRDGSPVELFVKKEKYRAELTQAVGGVQQSTLPVLEKHKAGGAWALRTILVGIGLSIEVGLGPIFKLAAAPRFRALFSNSNDPAIP